MTPSTASPGRHRPAWRTARQVGTAFVFLLPTFVILGTFLIFPMIASLYYSLTEYNVVQPPKFIGLDNFRRLADDPIFITAFKNTIIYSVGVIPGVAIVGLILALLVNQVILGINFFRLAYYVPFITSIVVVGITWKWLYQEDGPINYFLSLFGISAIAFLSDPATALYSVMFVTVWHAAGYYMVLYLAGLQAIPVDLEEAAMIDGATRLQRLWHITLPLLKPTVTLVIIIASIGAMKVFGEIYIMTQGGPADTTNTVVFYVYVQAFKFLQMGYASAMAVILFIMLLLLSIVSIRFSERGGPSY